MSLYSAILLSARWLVPATQRVEWLAEWDAELQYIQRTCGSRALTFCLGAYQDAFWLRRESPQHLLDSPLRCLGLLVILASISLAAAGSAVFSPFRNSYGLVELKNVSAGQFATVWKNGAPGVADFAFYRRASEPVATSRARHLYSMVLGTRNLFGVLNIRVPASADRPILVVSREIWRLDFDNDCQFAGHFLEFGGKRLPVTGVIDADDWPLGERTDAWLLDNAMPPDSRGFVVGRIASGAPIVLPRPPRQFRTFIGAFMLAMIGCLCAAMTALRTFGVSPGIRSWGFLMAKLVLLLAMLYFVASLCISAGRPFEPLFLLVVCPGMGWALRWAVAEQRRRCPVCLRFLSTPVQLGQASQGFLGWYGTEHMCAHGHGVLRVPEHATSCFASPQWVNLEELCSKIPG